MIGYCPLMDVNSRRTTGDCQPTSGSCFRWTGCSRPSGIGVLNSGPELLPTELRDREVEPRSEEDPDGDVVGRL